MTRIELEQRAMALGHTPKYLQGLSYKKLADIVDKNFSYTRTAPEAPKMTDTPKLDTTPAPAPAPTPAPAPAGRGLSDFLDALTHEVRQQLLPEIDAKLANVPVGVRTLELKTPNGDYKVEYPDTCHPKLPNLVRWLTPEHGHVWLYGPAGSGKTTAAFQAAQALGKAFGRSDYECVPFSASPNMLPHELLGYKNPVTGDVVLPRFFRAVTEGHLFLLDEADSAPALLTVINMLLDSGKAVFADREVPVHPHFRLIAAANTLGKGANATYSGRSRMDFAFLNRFIHLAWDYDETLEMEIATAIAGKAGKSWCKYVQKVRATLTQLGANAPRDILVSPRASIKGARMLQVDPATTHAELAEALMFSGLSATDRSALPSPTTAL
jgi:hypothetical protein